MSSHPLCRRMPLDTTATNFHYLPLITVPLPETLKKNSGKFAFDHAQIYKIKTKVNPIHGI